jgi:uncharacterized protein (TIGR00299 family) protein
MRVLYFDAFSGVSGDMTVGALLDLGVDFEHLKNELRKLPLQGYEIRASRRFVNGIDACKFDVEVGGQENAHDHRQAAKPEHSHHHHVHPEQEGATSGQGGEHSNASGAEVTHGHAHEHRAFREIRAMIEGSTLSAAVKSRALAIFTRLAVAEGHVHGVAPDDVTFHEVGAVDSIVDIVGTAVALVALGVEHTFVSVLPLGSGLVRSQHGVIPVPGPATIELLRDFPVRPGDGNGELITPTGAAIVSTLAKPDEPLPELRVERIGYGAGSKTFADRPNVLRLLLGAIAAPSATDEMVVIETNIDDTNPELYDYVIERLFAAGARDVWLTPAQMKKNRPGVVLHALVDTAARAAVVEVMLRETSSIGVRYFTVGRTVLPREQLTLETEFGPLVVKIARAPDGTVNVAPEYDTCSRAARERGVPLKLVYQAAIAAAQGRGPR